MYAYSLLTCKKLIVAGDNFDFTKFCFKEVLSYILIIDIYLSIFNTYFS